MKRFNFYTIQFCYIDVTDQNMYYCYYIRNRLHDRLHDTFSSQ